MRVFLAVIRHLELSFNKNMRRVSGNLKHVHWLCMCICALRSEGSLAMETVPAVFKFLQAYFSTVRFDGIYFDIAREPHVGERELQQLPSGPRQPVFVSCPLSREPLARNLASTVNSAKVNQIHSTLGALASFDLMTGARVHFKAGDTPSLELVAEWAKAAQTAIGDQAAAETSAAPATATSIGRAPGLLLPAALAAPSCGSAAPDLKLPAAPAASGAEAALPAVLAASSSRAEAAPERVVLPPKQATAPQPSPPSTVWSTPGQPVGGAAAAHNFNFPPGIIRVSEQNHEICEKADVTLIECNFEYDLAPRGTRMPFMCSIPVGQVFGQAPIVMHLPGTTGGNPWDLTKKERKSLSHGVPIWSTHFLQSMRSCVWLSFFSSETQVKKSWKSPPPMWIDGLAASLQQLGVPIHIIGLSRGAWWGSEFVGHEPSRYQSAWLFGGYPAVSNIEEQGVANATRLLQAHQVCVVNSETDHCSPAGSYATWFETLRAGAASAAATGRPVLHQIMILPAALGIGHSPLCDNVRRPQAHLEQVHEELHRTLSR